MNDLRPRHNRPGRPSTLARHGRLRAPGPWRTIARVAVAALAVALVSGTSVAAIATWDVAASGKKSVALVDRHGHTIVPQVGAMDGAFNVLLAGSDSGGGNPAYGERGETLNDVTMLLHVSKDHKNATVVSFPRDMFVAIPSCPDPAGGSFSSMSSQKINTTLTYGGLACTVLTVEKLTGMTIPYAAVIEFDGVIEMSNAIGGVPVCVAGAIDDPYTGLNLTAGRHTLQGATALAFLRTRHGVGDGSDLGRISNQQVFLSALMRTIKSADTLGNPGKVYGLAKAAVSNMTFSNGFKSVPTLASMAMALKNISLDKIVFVQYPTNYVQGGVAADKASAIQLFDALASDTPISLTGTTGVGSEADPNAPASSGAGSPGAGSSSAAPAPSAPSDASSGASSTPGSGPAPTDVALPDNVHGQTASQYTCSKPFQD
ncbi:MAG: LytR family transcriptional regulator [Microbacteriaceae bacterium]|nr:MAG: LytR family transcriptional regulator [Microbacteriaceae bacterium]